MFGRPGNKMFLIYIFKGTEAGTRENYLAGVAETLHTREQA